VRAQDGQPNQHRAHQHNYPHVNSSVKSLITGRSSQQARGRAQGAEGKIEFLHPAAREQQEQEENGGDDAEYSAENPGARRNLRRHEHTCGPRRCNHLAHGNRKKNDRMHQRNYGAFAVGENGKRPHG